MPKTAKAAKAKASKERKRMVQVFDGVWLRVFTWFSGRPLESLGVSCFVRTTTRSFVGRAPTP